MVTVVVMCESDRGGALPSVGHGVSLRIYWVCWSQYLILAEDRFSVRCVVCHDPSYSRKVCHVALTGVLVDTPVSAFS